MITIFLLPFFFVSFNNLLNKNNIIIAIIDNPTIIIVFCVLHVNPVNLNISVLNKTSFGKHGPSSGLTCFGIQ